MSDIDHLSGAAYESNDPIDWATHLVKCLVEARETALKRRSRGLAPLPAWVDTSTEAVARKVLGRLMDAGWRPPADVEVDQATARSRAISARFAEWRSSLTPEEWRRVIAYYSSTNEFPPDLQPPRDALSAKGPAE